MTHRLITDYAKNYCNRTVIVKVIIDNVVTCFFWATDTAYTDMMRANDTMYKQYKWWIK